MELKPGYKQTEVGVIPEDWEVQSLLSAVRIASGQVSPKIEPYKSMILVAPDHIESSTGRLLSRVTAADQGAISGKYLFGPGDILYSKIRPYLCKATIAHFSGLCSADMYPLAPAKGVSSGYMLAVILGHRFTKYAESVSVRSGMPKINREELSGFSIPIPPDQEQIRIAETLGDVDQLLDLLEGLIAKKQGIKQAAMQELLTGKRRLPGFEGEWVVRELGSLGTWRGGMTPSMQNPDYWNQGDFPWISSGDVKISRLSDTSQHVTAHAVSSGAAVVIPGKSIVLVTSSGILRKQLPVSLLERPMAINQDIKALIPARDIDSSYLLHALTWAGSQILKSCMKTGTTVESIEFAWLKRFTIPVPSHEEQIAIAMALSDMEDELVEMEAQRAKASVLKQGMMQQLLTGKIRLK